MQIALIAQDEKKELMAQLCIAYCGILAKHSLCSTATTGNFNKDATGLEIEMVLPGAGGGTEQIASRIAYDEIDLLLYFRDATDEFDSEDANLIQLCDT
ncbi:MAG: methylglyoxal synthase, partial [Clostridia bacterium]|nr:methylglyoxal synthase [Clostridia bacterium]